MQTHPHSQISESHGLGRQVIVFYCRSCHRLFGKTISVMLGEAEEQGRWYGYTSCIFINWLLRDPNHCQNELNDFRTFIKHSRFLLGVTGIRLRS